MYVVVVVDSNNNYLYQGGHKFNSHEKQISNKHIIDEYILNFLNRLEILV